MRHTGRKLLFWFTFVYYELMFQQMLNERDCDLPAGFVKSSSGNATWFVDEPAVQGILNLPLKT